MRARGARWLRTTWRSNWRRRVSWWARCVRRRAARRLRRSSRRVLRMRLERAPAPLRARTKQTRRRCRAHRSCSRMRDASVCARWSSTAPTCTPHTSSRSFFLRTLDSTRAARSREPSRSSTLRSPNGAPLTATLRTFSTSFYSIHPYIRYRYILVHTSVQYKNCCLAVYFVIYNVYT